MTCYNRECYIYCGFEREKSYIDKKPYSHPDEYIKEQNQCKVCNLHFRSDDKKYTPCVSKIWKTYYIFCSHDCYVNWLNKYNQA